ncbi:MAG: type II toxin-antitoxin system VapC family toxin, partial [Acetobacteraceae bacterium]
RRAPLSLVLDSSATLSWCFADECTPAATRLLRRIAESGALVPALWRLEVANGLLVAVRRGRITKQQRDSTLRDLRQLAIAADPETDDHAWTAALQLADRFGLTVYDAAYLELARRRRMPLATLDRPLRQAAVALAVELWGPNDG